MFKVNQLNGFGFGKRAVTTITQVLSATSTNSANITAPVGIAAGDLIVMYDCATSDSGPASVVPTGFTQIYDSGISGSNGKAITSYKIAAGTEGGTTITGMVGAGALSSSAKAIYVFRGDNPIAVITALDVDNTNTTGNPGAQTITSATGVVPLVVLGFYVVTGNTLVNPRTFTVGGIAAKDGEVNASYNGPLIDTDLWIAYKIYNSAPADVVVDMDDEGADNFLGSCYLQAA